jgi:hypothetical protein
MKRSEKNEKSENLKAKKDNAKRCFFGLFCNDAKRRNLKRNKHRTKRKQNEKEAKNCHHFCFEAK